MRLLSHPVAKNRVLDLYCLRRCLTQSCTNSNDSDLTNSLKRKIEDHWRHDVNKIQFDSKNGKNKFYVLSMFPYPSGNLHMGHVRVYSISDAVARFYRMTGKNVFHPIGWDSFGLPAENAAIQRKVDPADWTEKNIKQMKEQLKQLGCSFDWSHELSTCDENYYKWTQKLFLLLYKNGMVYQNKALVNWDPVDQTVLAEEQIDSNGCSWRSGAKVEKKLLKQWFIRTTKFAKPLLEGLSDPILEEWRDIVNLQRHWIGECNGYAFNLDVIANDNPSKKVNILRIWTEHPEKLLDPEGCLILKSTHYLKLINTDAKDELRVHNPFCKRNMQIIFVDDVEYPEHCDSYLAAPNVSESDLELLNKLRIPVKLENGSLNEIVKNKEEKEKRNEVIKKSRELDVGGYEVSSKLQDWLISRQRYWGTPIPIVHCENCGAVPVDESQLPVRLSKKHSPLENAICPKCQSPNAKRETDTMDTFVDSSWYYLRYLNAKNETNMLDENLVKECMPVDLYIGGKEHAVLHLYYARFMNHFLHSTGLVPYPEPFKRLLVQGMVMGRSFRVKGTGKYLKEHEVQVINSKKNKAVEKVSGSPVVMTWEKMSKSKLNGVDPSDMMSEYGCDTTRLIILADVAPTSHRNWSTATFPGILNWQKRLWLTINDFDKLREDDSITRNSFTEEEYRIEDEKLYDSRNYYLKGVTFNFRYSHQLSVGISKMQGLTNSIRRAPKYILKYGKEFERALAWQIIMLAPLAPHFASELWSRFTVCKNRINTDLDEIRWNENVFNQTWPEVDMEYKLDLSIKINGFENAVLKLPRKHVDKMTYNDAMDIAFNTESVVSYTTGKKIRKTNFVVYPGCEAILNIFVDKLEDENNNNKNLVINEISNK